MVKKKKRERGKKTKKLRTPRNMQGSTKKPFFPKNAVTSKKRKEERRAQPRIGRLVSFRKRGKKIKLKQKPERGKRNRERVWFRSTQKRWGGADLLKGKEKFGETFAGKSRKRLFHPRQRTTKKNQKGRKTNAVTLKGP